MGKRLTVALAAMAIFASVLGGSASAITGNYVKDFEHDYVGLLVFYTTPDPATGDYFSHRCSGTLISTRVIVTAGHCTEGVDTGRVYFQQAAAPNYDPAAFGGWGGDPTTGYPYKNGVTFKRADNYGFSNFEGYPDTKDAGVVVLDKSYTPPSGKFGILPTAGQLKTYVNAALNAKKQVRFTVSGYGLSDQDPQPVSFRERLMAESYMIEDSSGLTTYNLKTTANPSQDKGGTCNGDSGGPVFFKGTRTIAAVTSFGMNGQCKGQDFSYRLDRTPVLNWIKDPNRVDAG